MIYVTGDTHGEYGRITMLDQKLKAGDICVVCGDFGYIWKDDVPEKYVLDDLAARPYTLLFVDGNHENFDALYRYPEEKWNGGKVHRIRKNILHLCRGQIFDICGKTFFTFGGAYSVDKHMRREGASWWAQEMPTDAEFAEGNKNLDLCGRKVDYIITHAAPEEPMKRLGLERNGEYPLNNYLEYVRETVEYDHWYMGHLHRDEDVWMRQSVLWMDMREIG